MKRVILNWWLLWISVWSSNVSSCPQMEDRNQNMFTFNERTSQNWDSNMRTYSWILRSLRFGSDGRHVQTHWRSWTLWLLQWTSDQNKVSEIHMSPVHDCVTAKTAFTHILSINTDLFTTFLKWQKFPVKCRKVTVFYESAVKVWNFKLKQKNLFYVLLMFISVKHG